MAMRRKYHRTGFTAAQSAELWDRWKKGEGLNAIGRALGRRHNSIWAHLRPTGGIRPPARRRSPRALSLAEREEISRGIVEGRPVRAIARGLGRSASTVSREVSRNGGAGRYRAEAAEKLAWRRALRPLCKLAIYGQLRQAVARKLAMSWSPEQIAGWLRRIYPENEAQRVSHETIYRSLYVQTRGVLKQQLLAHLRSQRIMRRSQHASKRGARADPSSMPCRSASDPHRLRIGLCRATGRATCSGDRTRASSSRWLNGILAMSCLPRSAAGTRKPWSAP